MSTIQRLRRAMRKPVFAPFRAATGWLGSHVGPHLAPRDPDFPHERVRPRATYAPWRADREFARAYETIRGHTLVDVYRCHELWALVAETARRHPDADVLEVGVWRGGTGCLLGERCRSLGLNAQVWLCDTFSGVVKTSERDTAYIGGEHADTSAAMVRALASRMGLSNVGVLEGIFPDATGERIEDRRFQLCHIDVDVYLSARDVLDWMWPRLVQGGVVVFDDYGFRGCEGVTRCVEEQRDQPDRVTVHNLNGHAVVIKLRSTV
jgi:O-methyltransferase